MTRRWLCIGIICCDKNNAIIIVIYLRQRRRYMFLPVFICLFVCVCARLLKNASMDLDEMLRVDRRRDMDELLNFWA